MDWNKFQEIFGDIEIREGKIVVKSEIAKTLDFIKNNYSFDILKEIIAIDSANGEFELIYKLYSTVNEEDVLVSILVKEEVETVSEIFASAIADEREIYDLFGINFIGHKDLKRLYMPESWKGNPLKKDYEQKDERLNWND